MSDEETLYVKFEMDAVENAERTAAEGRPCFDDVPFVTIKVRGDNLNVTRRPVRDDDKRRFPRRWEQFLRGEAATHDGTPLREWSACARGQVKELAHFDVHTVEQLAATSDDNCRRMGPYLRLRDAAKAFLEQSKGLAPLTKLQAENAELKSQLEMHAKQTAELAARLDALTKADGRAQKTK